MFEDLVQFDPEKVPSAGQVIAEGTFTPLDKASVQSVIEAQIDTASWLEEIGAPTDKDIDTVLEKRAAREAFKAITFDGDSAAQKAAVTTMKTPAAVRHLVGMLSAYDWDFVDQAKELRSYAVAKILEETNNPNANIRLKALQMLGNVTEVALFTARVEVTQKDASEDEIERRLRERLARFITPTPAEEVVDVPVLSEVAQPTTPDA